MSWDIVIFHSTQKINDPQEVDELQLVPFEFTATLEKHFSNIILDGGHREIKGNDYAIDYFAFDEPTSNIMLSLYGEPALFELVQLAKRYNWQIFDTGCGQMIDLDHPEKNGYAAFQSYLQYVLKGKG
jgi:hypothetical protein